MRFRSVRREAAEGLPRGRGLHDTARHDLRRELHRHFARASAGPGAGQERSRSLQAFIEECRKIGTAQEEIDRAEKKGYATGVRGRPSLPLGHETACLCRQLHPHGLRHRRDFRLSRARSARPRFRPQIQAQGQGRGGPRGRGPGDVQGGQRGLCRRRQARQFLVPEWHGRRGCEGRGGARLGKRNDGREDDHLPPARLGRVAPALLGLPDPGDPLREMRRRARAGEGSAGAAAGRCHLR